MHTQMTQMTHVSRHHSAKHLESAPCSATHMSLLAGSDEVAAQSSGDRIQEERQGAEASGVCVCKLIPSQR